MNETIQLITTILAFFSTGGLAVSWLFFRKQTERLKNAEAFDAEVKVLQREVEALGKQIETYRKWREEDQRTIVKLDEHNTQLLSDKTTTEIKHARNKKAINRAYECTFCDNTNNCPVLRQRAQNEEEFLIELEKQKKTR